MGRRLTYAQRTRAHGAAAKTLARAFNEKPMFEERDGETWRVWSRSYVATNDEVIRALRRKRAIEESELSHDLPPSAVKDALTRGWLVKHGTLLFVTAKAAADLKLPSKTWDGLTIRFAK